MKVKKPYASLPSKIKILDKTYPVEYYDSAYELMQDDTERREYILGLMNGERKAIRIYTGGKVFFLEHVLWAIIHHEMIHAILEEIGYEDMSSKEPFVEALTLGIRIVAQQNKGIWTK